MRSCSKGATRSGHGPGRSRSRMTSAPRRDAGLPESPPSRRLRSRPASRPAGSPSNSVSQTCMRRPTSAFSISSRRPGRPSRPPWRPGSSRLLCTRRTRSARPPPNSSNSYGSPTASEASHDPPTPRRDRCMPIVVLDRRPCNEPAVAARNHGPCASLRLRFEARAADEEGLVAEVRRHAWEAHSMTLTRDEALLLESWTIKHRSRSLGNRQLERRRRRHEPCS